MRASTLGNNVLAINREIDSRYDAVIAVRDRLPEIELVAGMDIDALIAELENAQDFTGITVISGAEVAWDAVNKVLTIPRVEISTTIQPNSVVLGTDTTGNYVNSVVAGAGVTVTGVVGEGWTPSIAIAPVGTAGTYTKVSTNDKGQVVSGKSLSANDIPNLDASKITSGIIDAARLPAYVDGSVADNAVPRYDGTTGKLRNSGVYIDDNNFIYTGGLGNSYTNIGNSQFNMCGFNSNINSFQFINRVNGKGIAFYTTSGVVQKVMEVSEKGNVLLTSGTGALGYGAGAGGTVTQLTSKSTAVTLNKPCGMINTHTEALAAGATVYFQLNNSLLSIGDGVIITNASYGTYSIRVGIVTNGSAYIYITNTGGTSLSHVIPIQFQVIKGSSN